MSDWAKSVVLAIMWLSIGLICADAKNSGLVIGVVITGSMATVTVLSKPSSKV